MSNIERADKIVGHKQTALHDFEGSRERLDAYLTWLAAQPSDEVAKHAKTTTIPNLFLLLNEGRLADIICAIDDARKPKGDGLPPGPWKADKTNTYEFVHDTAGCTVAVAPKFGDFNHTFGPAIATYIARCGSQPVRDILAACDDAELARWAKIIAAYKLTGIDVVCDMGGKGICVWSYITLPAHPR